jgi:pyrroloquinoline-quinone synthase
MLAYFRARVTRAKRDSGEALEYVVTHATTLELQTRCVEALIRKTQVLWHLLDATYAAYIEPAWGPRGPRD